MRQLKIKKSHRTTLTADWKKEIKTKFTDVIRHQLVNSEILNQNARKQIKKPTETFCTGSAYEGHWDFLGFTGEGTYVYPHGAKYQGDFWNGEFHGNGTITYPCGQKLTATWQNGKIVGLSYQYEDGLIHEEKFDYCQLPDRRFQVEKNSKLKPPEDELLTNKPTKKIPENCYDTIDGYYNSKTKIVHGYDNHVMRVVTREEEKQITDKYRQETKNPKDFVEGMNKYWTTGRKKEVEELVELMQKEVKPEKEISTTESSTINSISIYSFHVGNI